MVRQEIGSEPLKGTKVQCGVAASMFMLYVLHLGLLILLRMFKPCLLVDLVNENGSIMYPCHFISTIRQVL